MLGSVPNLINFQVTGTVSFWGGISTIAAITALVLFALNSLGKAERVRDLARALMRTDDIDFVQVEKIGTCHYRLYIDTKLTISRLSNRIIINEIMLATVYNAFRRTYDFSIILNLDKEFPKVRDKYYTRHLIWLEIMQSCKCIKALDIFRPICISTLTNKRFSELEYEIRVADPVKYLVIPAICIIDI